MKELLLLGGSHHNSLISLLNGDNGKRLLPAGCRLKIVSCSDLDFSFAVDVNATGDIDCLKHPNLKQACLNAYNQTLIKYDPDRVIGLSLGSWHHAVDDPIWLSRYPADLAPVDQQREPISLNEVVERILPEVRLRVEVIKKFLRTRHRFFVIPVPPPSFFHEGAVAGIPPHTVLYIHNLCAVLFKTALEALKVTLANTPAVRTMEPNGFLRPELSCNFGDHHARGLEYGRRLWPGVEELLRRF
ncbi:MAG: hypothetical protein LBS31_11940 [Candidatus Adiutrix sp.]|jgi:hypothetical protein|nr:hypothetical protein [Candidatus Adiutrix sp.]